MREALAGQGRAIGGRIGAAQPIEPEAGRAEKPARSDRRRATNHTSIGRADSTLVMLGERARHERATVPYSAFFRARAEPWLLKPAGGAAAGAAGAAAGAAAAGAAAGAAAAGAAAAGAAAAGAAAGARVSFGSAAAAQFGALLRSGARGPVTLGRLRALLERDSGVPGAASVASDAGVASLILRCPSAARSAGLAHPSLLTWHASVGGLDTDCPLIEYFRRDARAALELSELVDADAPLHEASGGRKSVLAWAVATDNAAAVSRLCDRGATPYPDAARELLSRRCSAPVVRALMSRVAARFVDGVGADVTLMHIAATYPGCLELLRLKIDDNDMFRRKMHVRTRGTSMGLLAFCEHMMKNEPSEELASLVREDVRAFLMEYEPRLLG
jgi:hypothetical protein